MSPADEPAKPASPEPGSGGGRGGLLPVLVVLVIVGAAVLVGLALARHKPEPVAPPPAPAPAAPVSNPAPAAVEAVVAVTNAVPAPRPPRLQGIVYDPVRPGAIVDGQTVYPGDAVGDWRVIKITKDSVTLEDTNGTRQELLLGR